MKSEETAWLIVGGFVLYYLYSNSAAAKQQQALQSQLTANNLQANTTASDAEAIGSAAISADNAFNVLASEF